LFLTCSFLSSLSLAATTYDFYNYDVPGANQTDFRGINNIDYRVGSYVSGGTRFGLLFNGTSPTTIAYPGAIRTSVEGNNDAGLLVGIYSDGSDHGFLYDGVTYTALNYVNPNPLITTLATVAQDINNNDVIVGRFVPSSGAQQGFVLNGGAYSAGFSADPSATSTILMGVNDNGNLVGRWSDGSSTNSFFKATLNPAIADYTPIVNGSSLTLVFGINNAGVIVGSFADVSGTHGFVKVGATFETIDFPVSAAPIGLSVIATFVTGINEDGVLSGFWVDGSGARHGFTAIPQQVEPVYAAAVLQPINADGSSRFNAKKGVIPVKFTLTVDGTPVISPNCTLPPATIAVTKLSGSNPGSINESVYSTPSSTGVNFSIDLTECKYQYNLSVKDSGSGTYQVDILVDNNVVGSANFATN
jgi:hypothetical protein